MFAGGMLPFQLASGLLQGGQQERTTGRLQAVNPIIKLGTCFAQIVEWGHHKRGLIKTDDPKQVGIGQIPGNRPGAQFRVQQFPLFPHTAGFINNEQHGRPLLLFFGGDEPHRKGLLNCRASIVAQTEAAFSSDHNQTATIFDIGVHPARKGRGKLLVSNIIEDHRGKGVERGDRSGLGMQGKSRYGESTTG